MTRAEVNAALARYRQATEATAPAAQTSTESTESSEAVDTSTEAVDTGEAAAEVKAENASTNENLSSDVKNADETIFNDADFTEERLRKNAREILQMESVSDLTGDEFSSKEPDTLKEKVLAFFASFGNKVKTKEIGTVAVVQSSFRDDKAHGLTRNKVVAFKAVQKVLSEGKVIDMYTPDGKPYERVTLAAPITIAGEKYFMGVMVQRDNQSNRMYLHDVITEKATSSFNTEPATKNGEGIRDKGHLYITSILQNALNVNTSSEKSAKNSQNSTEIETNDENISKSEAEAKEFDALATEKVKGYDKLSAADKSMIRKIFREARATGISEADALSYARVAARTGLDIQFNEKECYKGKNEAGEDVYHAGFYDPENNRIVVNPETNKKHTVLLIHELSHAMRSYRTKGGEVKYFIDEDVKVSKEIWDEIKKYYADENGKLDTELALDEASAYYAEALYGTEGAIDLLLGEKPTLKQKILSFFAKSAEYYSTDEKLSREARRHFKKFKAMFDSFALRNTVNNTDAAAVGVKAGRRYSAELDNLTEKQYNSFGWVRANNVINAGYYRNFTENFAQAVSNLQKYPKSKSGEFMIAVYDIYSDSEIADVVVFASGTIESPNITKIIKFNLKDESELDTKRRNLYEIARRGVQPKAGEILNIYYKTDFIGGREHKRNSAKSVGNNNGLGVKRSRSEIKANPIVEFYVNEDENTVTYIYSNGDKITESLENSSKNSRRYSSETIENVAKSRYTEPDVKFSEKIKAKFTSVKDKLYIDAVDEMWGIEKYLKEKGGVKDYAAVVQQVRASETIAQTMIGVAQYDITESGKGKRLGDGITKIFKKYRVRKIEADFNDYLLHQLNVDRMTLRERSLEWQDELLAAYSKAQADFNRAEALVKQGKAKHIPRRILKALTEAKKAYERQNTQFSSLLKGCVGNVEKGSVLQKC